MSRPSVRTARLAGWIALPAALLLSGLAVGGASYSAFSSTTSNPTSNWATGTVALTDDDANTALFNSPALKPGSTGTKCIVVTSNGSLPSAVKLYGTGAATTLALSNSITLTVTQGTGGTFTSSGPTSCTGFTASPATPIFTGSLATFAGTYTDYASGLTTWSPTGSASESRTFQFTYTVDAAAPSSTQGGTAALGFTWEAQNS